jgi:hypothetical protein
MLREQLTAALSSSGERGAAAFLSSNPNILVWGFCRTGGHSIYALKEFHIGANYRADFVVCFSYSGTWEVHFIELEPVDDKIITKKGAPSNRLNSAISQLNDWREYVEANKSSVQSDLARWCRTKDLLGWYPQDHPPTNYMGDYLHESGTHVWFKYHIIIGRRAVATKDIRRKMHQYCSDGYISIGTYDRFIDIAENQDRFNKNPDESVYLPSTKDDSDQA